MKNILLIILTLTIVLVGCNKNTTEKDLSCTLKVICTEVISAEIDEDLLEILPADGIIFKNDNVKFSAGESVFDVLEREMKDNKIPMEFSKNPAFKTAYIEGINNLYEFSCGPSSGWIYKVNDEFQSVGCSQVFPKKDDVIEFIYTVDGKINFKD